MRIGTTISPKWLESTDNEDLRFLKQIGVDYVDITLDMVPGYRETGCFTREEWQRFVDRFARLGLTIERANSLFPYYRNAYLGRPEGEREVDHLCRIAEMVGETQTPVFGIQAFLAEGLVKNPRIGWSRREGRGGYGYASFDLNEHQRPEYQPETQVSTEELWANMLAMWRQVIPVAEQSGTTVAMHGNDPPIYESCGTPQIMCQFADFDRLFAEVPSAHNGMTFCVGTRYESGEDIFEGLRHFGSQGRIVHVHFRNVRGTLPRNREYAEVFHDDGEIDMLGVLKALREVDYRGVIDYDHAMQITGDTPTRRQYVAFAIGYIRGLIQAGAIT